MFSQVWKMLCRIALVRVSRQNTLMMDIATPHAREESWTIDGIRLCGTISGPSDGIPVLALHGWLDNAASFDALRTHFPDFRLLALDLPGHGLSGHRSRDAGYQIWDDLPQLVGLLDQLGWERCVLLGHSRGAMIATLLAAALPERARALVTLDGMLPYPAGDQAFLSQMRSFLRDRERLGEGEPRVFASIEDYVERRSRSGEPAGIAAQLAVRALEDTGRGFAWRGDPRLSGASAIKLNQGQIDSMLQGLTMPVLTVWATPGERLKGFLEAARNTAVAGVSNLTVADVPGHHHWHMEEETAARIAAVIRAFLSEKLPG